MGILARPLCSLYNNIVPASRLPARADMHLFKEGIEPKWEDPRCERGGSWTIPCQRDKAYLDRTWLRTVSLAVRC